MTMVKYGTGALVICPKCGCNHAVQLGDGTTNCPECGAVIDIKNDDKEAK